MNQSPETFWERHPRLHDWVRWAYGHWAIILRRPRYPLHQEIAEATRHLPRPVRYIQLGASDGLHADPLRAFVFEKNWQGVLVEPIPESFARLKRNYRHLAGNLEFVNAAVSYQPGRQILYKFSSSFLRKVGLERTTEFLQKTSFDREHLKKFYAPLEDGDIEAFESPGVTVESLCRQYLQGEFDVLAMDLEGYESVVLQHLDFTLVRPSIIIFEVDHLAPEALRAIVARLEAHGYAVQAVGSDRIAQRVAR
jgi:FkbM family methyltransferase